MVSYQLLILADTLIYGRYSISLEEVQATLMAIDLSKKVGSKEVEVGENLSVTRRSSKRE